jgi:broad specificity phosphatase PhoE
MARRGFPGRLVLVRHAQSAGNVANDAAIKAGLPVLDLAQRDMDVALSPLGEEQAQALHAQFTALDAPIGVVLSSPYRRAVDTATIALRAAAIEPPIVLDERLREREFGVLDRLTKVGIEARFPEQAAARAFLGKFFHRPPGGESWADVAGRVRSVVSDLRLDYEGETVVVVSHQAVITLFRYVLESLTEAELLDLDRREQIANTAVTIYEAAGDGMQLMTFNDASHLPDPITTSASDVPVAPR